MSIINDLKRLESDKILKCPSWLLGNLHYACLSGSHAYGSNTPESDHDIFSVCLPPKNFLCPWEYNKIYGFDQLDKFQNYEQHHIFDPTKQRELDFTCFNIVDYFRLLADGNPNHIDNLFVPRDCVLFSSVMWEQVRNERKMFLSKRCLVKFKAYSFSQMKKLDRVPIGSRKEDYEATGYDKKFLMHTVRLALSAEQILDGDLDLQRDKEIFKSIRRGEWTLEQGRQWFMDQERKLDRLAEKSSLPNEPDVGKIRQLLARCINSHYSEIVKVDQKDIIYKIKELVNQL